MARRTSCLLLCILFLGCGSWLLAQHSPTLQTTAEGSAAKYTICNTGPCTLMFEPGRGKTWMLRKLDSGEPNWLPIPRIDSEKEAAALWRKSANFPAEAGKKDQPSSMDQILKNWGYVDIPLDRLNAGYLGIPVRIDGKNVYLMLDTGARSRTWIGSEPNICN